MAVSQLWKKRKFVATAVLNELTDEDEEPRQKKERQNTSMDEKRRGLFF